MSGEFSFQRRRRARIEYVSPEIAALRAWLASWWPRWSKATKLVQDYQRAIEEYPNVFADIARRAHAFSTTLGDTPADSHAMSRSRDLWIHIQTMARLDADDLRHLEGQFDE